MASKVSLQEAGCVTDRADGSRYDCAKAIMSLGKKNGWDLESLSLVARDLPFSGPFTLTKDQIAGRNRTMNRVLQRFGEALTPPVPYDLELHVKEKKPSELLPWEEEVKRKIGSWRAEVAKLMPEIVQELSRMIRERPGK